tara:strand:+ start:6645 stop:7781 length:1137 start_codon:yes stop_codon:yes gene_type:complete
MALDRFDVCIAGAGVIGLAIALQLSNSRRFSNKAIVVVEREAGFGQHISSRNSEVIHAGIYYAADSLKARLCLRGKRLLYEHCQRHGVGCRQLGKLIVAGKSVINELEALQAKAARNGVDDLQWLDRRQLQQREPAVEADYALLSPSTGIIDSHAYMQSLLHLAQNNGVKFAPRTEIKAVSRASQGFIVDTRIGGGNNSEAYQFGCESFVNCAGLDAGSLARKIEGGKQQTVPEIHLCKGDYFSYSAASPFGSLVYPLPEKNTQGLSIHSTLDMAGQVRFGPDSEYVDERNYDVSPSKREIFAAAIATYFPAISAEKLQPAYSGIRPKLAARGEPAADFIIENYEKKGTPGLIQLFGIESPGLTASLAIADEVVQLLS